MEITANRKDTRLVLKNHDLPCKYSKVTDLMEIHDNLIKALLFA